MPASAIYFPLRSNAASLLVGAPVHSLVRRIKLAALLHDEVWLEEGLWEAQAGPRGSASFWFPAGDRELAWQTPRERGAAMRREFSVGVRLDSAPEGTPFRPVIHSETTLNWRATFEPLKRELAKGYPWILFGRPEEASTEGLIRPWIDADERDPNIRRKMPIPFHRSLVVLSANQDLAAAANLGVPVSMDNSHAEIASARLQRGDASSVFGQRALDILLPAGLERLDWAEIDDLRHPHGNHRVPARADRDRRGRREERHIPR